MRKLSLLFALLPAAAGVHAETLIPLWNGAVYNQPVETIKAQNGVFDCSQRGRQMLCRGNVEFAGHNDCRKSSESQNYGAVCKESD